MVNIRAGNIRPQLDHNSSDTHGHGAGVISEVLFDHRAVIVLRQAL
jgi:hypothetical protein